ncbi:hypothetical protein JL722_8521 [Aureococcus anophagefferens]|nr:hypothetical protein JL722_8521 [Aureococcus anophagefferens]
MPHTAEELAMLAFLRFARGAEPMSAAWRTLERNFLEEIDLEALPLIETADLDDLVPASARRALDAALGRWLAAALALLRLRWRGAAADGARGARAARARQRVERLAAAAAAEAERAEQAALKERAKARARRRPRPAPRRRRRPRRAKEAADKARAKAEKRRRAAASAKAAEADAERSRAETARRDEAAARARRGREDAASQRERQAARLRQRTAAEVVVEEEDDDEAAVAERLEERLKEERLEAAASPIARVLDLDDARRARYAAPEAACEAANDVLRATVELLSWDDFVRRGLLVRTRDGGLDWVDDDPALRGPQRAVADLAEHAARATRAAAGCRAAAAELRSTFDGRARAGGVRRRLKRFTHIVADDGEFEKVLVPEEDLEAIGLWRDKFQRRDVYAAHKRYGPGKGFALVPKNGWLVRFYVVDPSASSSDVTAFINHRFHNNINSASNDDLVRRFSFTLGVQPLTARASRELWARRLGAPAGAGGLGAPAGGGGLPSLNQYGLKYDDVKIEQDADYAALGGSATRRSGARRMKRAFDISFKKKSLPADLQRLQAPLAPYATPLIDEAKARRVERELLNHRKSPPLFHITPSYELQGASSSKPRSAA